MEKDLFQDSSVRTSSMVKPRIVIPMKETRDKRIWPDIMCNGERAGFYY